MILQVIASMVGTLAFAILFNAPRKEYFFCGVNGGLAWLAYLLFIRAGVGVALASMGATVILTLAARGFSSWRKCPVTVFLITGIFVLVPGMNDLAQFSAKGLETFKIAGAIALGIVFGFAIPQRVFNKIGKR